MMVMIMMMTIISILYNYKYR